jgi:GTP-binding protein
LYREARGNVAIRVRESREKDAFEVAGRGELQLGVLIETMRRRGFELSISRPRVLFTSDPSTGKRLEPIEEVMVDVDEEFAGIVDDKMSRRKAEMQEMRPSGGGKLRLTFLGPTRGLIGHQGEFLTDTAAPGRRAACFLATPRTKVISRAAATASWSRPPTVSPSPMRCGTSKSAGRCSSSRVRRSTRG